MENDNIFLKKVEAIYFEHGNILGITAPQTILYMRLAMIKSLHTVSGDAKCSEMASLVSM